MSRKIVACDSGNACVQPCNDSDLKWLDKQSRLFDLVYSVSSTFQFLVRYTKAMLGQMRWVYLKSREI